MKRLGFFASVAAAIGSVLLGHLYFRRLEAEVSGGPRVAVLVAAGDLAVNGVVTEQNVAVRDVPQAYVEGRQIRAPDLQKVLGARIAGGLKANERVALDGPRSLQRPTPSALRPRPERNARSGVRCSRGKLRRPLAPG